MLSHWADTNPVMADNARDKRDEAGDVRHHADSILDTMRHKPDVIEGCLSEEEAFALDELLSKLSAGTRKVADAINESLGELA